MKKLIAITLFVSLFLCGCQVTITTPTTQETTPTQTEPQATAETVTEPTQPATVPTTQAPTEPVMPDRITVYLLEKSTLADSGHISYIYDDNYNIIEEKVYTIENQLMYIGYYSQQDANGMFGQYRSEWDGVAQDVHRFTWFQDGKLSEEQYDPGFSGDQCEYDNIGNLTAQRRYYDGILDYTVYYEYDGELLLRVYAENKEGILLFECVVDSGLVINKSCYDTEGILYCTYEYLYDEHGNLVQETLVMDGERMPYEIHTYRAVEVDADRASFILQQQKYLMAPNFTAG